LPGTGLLTVDGGSAIRVEDELTVNSSTLPLGTPVNLTFTLGLDGRIIYSGVSDITTVFPIASAEFSALDLRGEGQVLFLKYLSYDDPLLVNHSGIIDRILTGSFKTAVGNLITLSYSLQVLANSTEKSGFVEVDFGNTSRFFADSETASVILTSSSGHNYASPVGESVPTPALLPGLIALSAALRSQRHKACA
jgi:hypothetical protein